MTRARWCWPRRARCAMPSSSASCSPPSCCWSSCAAGASPCLPCTIVPASLAAAVLVLSLFGMSFNIMTLGGLAASVGLVIDDVIVMIEHIARRSAGRRAAGGAALGAASRGRNSSARSPAPPPPRSSCSRRSAFSPASPARSSRRCRSPWRLTLIASWALTALAVPLLAGALIDFKRWQDPGATARGRALPPAWTAAGRAVPPPAPAPARRPRCCWPSGSFSYTQCADRLHAQSR